ncbi:MAG: hypothetical protein GY782_05415 [Gammaproteobacteria bacterium]|nr:hypothetical protein [Gammaproteobacteria bacterium]
MLWKWLFSKSADEPGGSTTTDELKKRLQSPLGENDKVNTPYQARSIDFNTPLKTSSEYLDGKQRTPNFDHGLLEDADDEELTDKGAATDPGYVRKRWSIFFSIVCALLFAAVVGYALISFVFLPLWLLNLTVITAYLVLDGVAAIAAAAIGYYIFKFNQLYAAYSLNRTKTKVMVLLAIIIAAVLFTVISVASGGLFPLLSSIVLVAGLLFATLSTFVLGLSLWSIMKFGKSKVDGKADDSIQLISFCPTDIVDFDSEGKNKFLPNDSIDAHITEGESYHIFYEEMIKPYLTPTNSSGAGLPAKVSAYFIPARDDRIEKRAFNDDKYDEFIKLFEDIVSSEKFATYGRGY